MRWESLTSTASCGLHFLGQNTCLVISVRGEAREEKYSIVTSCLCRGFIPADEAVFLGEVLQFGQLGAHAMTPLITLVGQKNDRKGIPIAEGHLTERQGAVLEMDR